MLDISAAGHYQAGERIEDGVREIVEELGVEVDYSRLIPLGIKLDVGTYGKITNREFCHVFLLQEARRPNEYTPSDDELSGLVEISIPDGLALFSSMTSEVLCRGVMRDSTTGKWQEWEGRANVDAFIPRLDPYYLKIFIMAERLLQNIEPLAI
jgi:hypothetical protein